VYLFHYHLVTSQLRDVEARYLGRLGFGLVARYGRIGDDHVAVESGTSWDKLDREGFKLRLSELERGAVNVVVQPGHWRVPRVDHLGIVLDEDDFHSLLARASDWNLRVQEHGGRRTFVATNAGYRLEVHPPRDWIVLTGHQSRTSPRQPERARDPAGRLRKQAFAHARAADRAAEQRALEG